MNLTHGMKAFNVSDYTFAKYLNDCDKNWSYTSIKTEPPYTVYKDSKGNIIATVIYNNRDSTRKIFIPAK